MKFVFNLFEFVLYRYMLQLLKRVYLYEIFGYLFEIGSNMFFFGGVWCEYVLVFCNGVLDLELLYVFMEGVFDL